MSKYGFNIEWSDEDGGYIATCPDFPGLSGFGETVDDALQEAKIVLELFMETKEEAGEPLPEPSTVEEYSGQFRLRLPKSFHKMLAQSARREGCSLNSYVNHLLSLAHGGLSLTNELKPILKRIEEKSSPSVTHYQNVR